MELCSSPNFNSIAHWLGNLYLVDFHSRLFSFLLLSQTTFVFEKPDTSRVVDNWIESHFLSSFGAVLNRSISGSELHEKRC